MTFSIPTHKCGLVIGRGESPHSALPLPGLALASPSLAVIPQVVRT